MGKYTNIESVRALTLSPLDIIRNSGQVEGFKPTFQNGERASSNYLVSAFAIHRTASYFQPFLARTKTDGRFSKPRISDGRNNKQHREKEERPQDKTSHNMHGTAAMYIDGQKKKPERRREGPNFIP
jgi:hypothetical protein